MKSTQLIAFSIILLLSVNQPLKAQNKEWATTGINLLDELIKRSVNTIFINNCDVENSCAAQMKMSEQAFESFEGKIIKSIEIKQFGFERNLDEGFIKLKTKSQSWLNRLHTATKNETIRENIFIKINKPLVAEELADNERFLRTIEFIQDARIFVQPSSTNNDSVDLIIVTKDLFSITGIADIEGSRSIKGRISDANIAGRGHKMQVTGYWDEMRFPQAGYELLYSKNNIGGSFVNSTIAWTQINTGKSEGTEDESAIYIRLERPLVSPFSKFAGGLEISQNQSENAYRKDWKNFLNYKYDYFDFWLGYNLGRHQFNNRIKRNNIFLSGRYMQIDFKKTPTIIGDNFDPVYNSKKIFLSELSLFRQDFYKLNYIYGFGTTEDIPTGYSISATAGWTKQLYLERPYLGFQIHKNLVTRGKGFVDFQVRIGGYYRKQNAEDIGLLAGLTFYSPLFQIGNWTIREKMKFSYSGLYHKKSEEALRINNSFGLQEFSTDSVQGLQRFSLQSETIFYTPKTILGFNIAPFITMGISLLNQQNYKVKHADGFTGFGGGIRLRNNNLVFGTMEILAMHFPRPMFNTGSFKITFKTDIRFRYKAYFIQSPDIIQLNKADF